MNPDAIVEARIHPAIGIARVGNAEAGPHDYFIGPEVPNPTRAPAGGYRDGAGRLKRQAARFRIYGYDKKGNVVGEITDAHAAIEWHVHAANKKAAWYNFDVALDLPEAASVRSPRRNSNIRGADRAQLSIDPGARQVSKDHPRARFDTGRFFDVPVDLGEIRYSAGGRLLFMGGRGKSAPVSSEYSVATFANNPGWHDDTSDGPVSATVAIRGRKIPVDSAWVVTAPPNYAPDLVGGQTMYDAILDALGWLIPGEAEVSFTRDILPVFQQFVDAQWVNAGFAAQFGWRGVVDCMRNDFIEKLATPPAGRGAGLIDPYQELRKQIFHEFRDPASTVFDPLRWPPLYGDAFFFMDSPPSPRAGFTVTKLVYSNLTNWMQGNFTGDYDLLAKAPKSLDDVPLQQQPEILDRAALHFCVGGPFHPGCEMTWPMRQGSMYRGKFRLRRRTAVVDEPDYGDFMTADLAKADGGPLSCSGPGDLTKWLAVPWQTDTASCRAGYSSQEFEQDDLIPAFWPSRVPDTVLSESAYRVVSDSTQSSRKRNEAFQKRDQWTRFLDPAAPFLSQLGKMIDHFHELGVIERREKDLGADFPPVIYVETLPQAGADPAAHTSNSYRPPMNQGFRDARFRARDQKR